MPYLLVPFLSIGFSEPASDPFQIFAISLFDRPLSRSDWILSVAIYLSLFGICLRTLPVISLDTETYVLATHWKHPVSLLAPSVFVQSADSCFWMAFASCIAWGLIIKTVIQCAFARDYLREYWLTLWFQQAAYSLRLFVPEDKSVPPGFPCEPWMSHGFWSRLSRCYF